MYLRPAPLGKGGRVPACGTGLAGHCAPVAGVILPAMRCLPALIITALLVQIPAALALALDLDRLREILKRIVDFITLGGVALALLAGLVFLVTWVLSHLRRPSDRSRRYLSTAALTSAWAPVLLTTLAAAGMFVPALAPFILRAFALAVALSAIAWCVSVAALIAGGTRRDLRRTRRALILAGTPWFCLVVYLATYL